MSVGACRSTRPAGQWVSPKLPQTPAEPRRSERGRPTPRKPPIQPSVESFAPPCPRDGASILTRRSVHLVDYQHAERTLFGFQSQPKLTLQGDENGRTSVARGVRQGGLSG